MSGRGDVRFYRAASHSAPPVTSPELPEGLQLSRWQPRRDGWPSGMFASGANRLWAILTLVGAFSRDDLTVYAVHSGERLLHRVLVTPRWYRFPFMAKDDVQLGDLWTDPDYRGRGLARLVAGAIHVDFSQSCGAFWYLVPEDNAASIRLVESLGYELVAVGTRTRPMGLSFLGQFKLTRPIAT